MSNEGFCSRLVQQRRERWIFEMMSLKAMVPLGNPDVEAMGK